MKLWHTNRSSNIGQNTRPYSNQQKKRTCKIVDFAVLADHSIKLKESDKKDKYRDLPRELKKNTKEHEVTIIPIVLGAFGTVTKGLLTGLDDLEVGGRVGIIQTTSLLRTARILWRLLLKLLKFGQSSLKTRIFSCQFGRSTMTKCSW